MDRSLMFILYPATNDKDVTVSIRSANGHNTPSPVAAGDISIQSSGMSGPTMYANIIWRNCTTQSRARALDTASKNQPWIYAVGPGEHVASDSQNAEINQHKAYGVFFSDMTKAQTTSSAIPQILGNSDINTTLLPSSVGPLIVVHAVCLGGSFVLLFPLGIILLRWWGSFKLHWIIQLLATTISVAGLVAAVALSMLDPEYRSFGKGHQIIGLVLVGYLLFQVALGYFHHLQYQKTKRRSWLSHLHLWLGRGVIIFGMINAVLGFLLADNKNIAIGAGILCFIIILSSAIIVIWGNRRRRSKVKMSSANSSGYHLTENSSQIGLDHM